MGKNEPRMFTSVETYKKEYYPARSKDESIKNENPENSGEKWAKDTLGRFKGLLAEKH